jgi:putative transcriptional regulator
VGIENVNLTNHFLIAMPNMADPYFSKTLTYVCEHNDKGALGVVVNRPIDMTMEALFKQVGIALASPEQRALPVYFGGPVQMERGFVLHQPVGSWQSTLSVEGRVGLTTSKDVLQSMAAGAGPRNVLVALGYAGWAAGQLEHELGLNGWLTVEASLELVFDLPAEDRLTAAMQLLGVDYASLSDEAGHA